MTNDAIKDIKKAEENGAQMIVNAKAEAAYRVEKTVAEIEKSKKAAEIRFKEILDSRVAASAEAAEAICAEQRAKAHADAKKIEQSAQAKMDKAVDIIVEEIKSLWQ